MKKIVVALCLLGLISFPIWSGAVGKATEAPAHDHDHEAEEKAHGARGEHAEHEEHAEGESKHAEHEEHEGHGEEGEEGGNSVGPNKGITEASEERGFKLAPEAIKNFEIKTQGLTAAGPWNLPSSARLLSGEEINIYSLRDGWFKRIDFNVVRQTPDQIVVNSKDLKPGDQVAIGGIGFLRITELAAFGGAPEGHSH